MPEVGPVLVALSTTGGVGMVKVAVEAGVAEPPCRVYYDLHLFQRAANLEACQCLLQRHLPALVQLQRALPSFLTAMVPTTVTIYVAPGVSPDNMQADGVEQVKLLGWPAGVRVRVKM